MNLVVYQSKHGHTLQYAHWIAEALQWECKALSEMDKSDWNQDDWIVFGGGIYMGKIQGLKKVLEKRKNKPLVLFACGANEGTEADLAYVKSRNLPVAIQSKIPFFFLPSSMDLEHTKGFLKWMMTKIVAILEKKPEPTIEDRKFLEMMKPSKERMDVGEIDELVRYVKERSRR